MKCVYAQFIRVIWSRLYIKGTVRCRYIMRSIFSQMLTKISHGSPVRASYGMYFVGSNRDLYPASLTAVMYPISCYTEPRYNGTRLHNVAHELNLNGYSTTFMPRFDNDWTHWNQNSIQLSVSSLLIDYPCVYIILSKTDSRHSFLLHWIRACMPCLNCGSPNLLVQIKLV